MTPARDEEKSTTGILRRKVAWWGRVTKESGWDGMKQVPDLPVSFARTN